MKVRFLDGPLQGETRDMPLGIAYRSATLDDDGIKWHTYVFDTFYPRALVNFMRVDYSSRWSNTAVIDAVKDGIMHIGFA